MFSAFNPSKCTHLEQWAADCAAPGELSWTFCRSRDVNPQPWVTSGFNSNALSIRPTTAHIYMCVCVCVCVYTLVLSNLLIKLIASKSIYTYQLSLCVYIYIYIYI